ncbi:MAG: hypothetical protein KBB11_01590 [Bacteroidales bacterium]|nr:hypothetical protein [Bacteroidales bacterium]HOY38971.1 hypothetical protein [Bacteroidales bacterium]
MQEEQKVPKWIKKLQESSWELELLISGGAIFSLFKVGGIIPGFFVSISKYASVPGLSIFMIFVMIALKSLTLGFVVHLAMRSYWLALVCVSYVFPGGLRQEKIGWRKPFRIPAEGETGMYKQIMSVDRFCGLIIYFSIILAVILAGFILFFITSFTIPVITLPVDKAVYFTVFYVVFVVYLFDFITFGLLRKIPYLSYIVYLPFRLIDFLTLRFLYQRSLLLLSTNIRKMKIALILFAYMLAAISFSYVSLYRTMHWPNILDQRTYRFQENMGSNIYIDNNYYLDDQDGTKVKDIAIQSLIVKDKCLKVFAVYDRDWDKLMDYISGKDGEKHFSDLALVRIDDSVYNNIEWIPTRSRDLNRFGMTAFIPITQLGMGRHVLTITANLDSVQMKNLPDGYRIKEAEIVFWKDY